LTLPLTTHRKGRCSMHMHSTRRLVFFFLFFFTSNSLFARELNWESGETRNMLVELYTSEGCSSCPPADKWISQLKQSNTLWKDIIPIAFHVDYWDYIGWRDRFASARYSQRQAEYKHFGLIRSVYTPGFVVNGKEWRGFFSARSLPGIVNENVGNLLLSITDSQIHGNFVPHQTQDQTQALLHVVLLGFDLYSRVNNVENDGKLLKHDFTVLEWQTAQAQNMDGEFKWKLFLPGLESRGTNEFGLAAWVSRTDSPLPIQSIGGFLR